MRGLHLPGSEAPRERCFVTASVLKKGIDALRGPGGVCGPLEGKEERGSVQENGGRSEAMARAQLS